MSVAIVTVPLDDWPAIVTVVFPFDAVDVPILKLNPPTPKLKLPVLPTVGQGLVQVYLH